MRRARRALVSLVTALASLVVNEEAASVQAFAAFPSLAVGVFPTVHIGKSIGEGEGRSCMSSTSSSSCDGGCTFPVEIGAHNIKRRRSSGLREDGGTGGSRDLSWRTSFSQGGRGKNSPAAIAVLARVNESPGHRFITATADSDTARLFPSASPRPGTAFSAAACFRGGGHASTPSSSDGDGRESCIGGAGFAANANVVGEIRGGDSKHKNRLIVDRVEDMFGAVSKALMVVLVPAFHLARLGFGMSLLFYGMAFRTFAFHVIVFRIAGLKKVQSSLSQLVSKYRTARKSIREAAAAAETVGERVIEGSELQAVREKMIREKKRLLSDGFLTEADTKYFMHKYGAELQKIKDEQQQFRLARSSVFAVRNAVSPKEARSSISGLYGGLVTCFTASTIQTAGQITLGLHIGNLLKTHILDLFGPILDPIGYRLDLDTYFDKEEIPYMGKANAMDGPKNMALNVLCYSMVFIVFRVHPSVALKASMVYYGGRVVTDYIVMAMEPARKKLGMMTIVHTPCTAVIHAGLSVFGFYHHRNVLHTAGIAELHPLAPGPGFVGLVEPCVRFFVSISKILARIDFFSCQFVQDPVELVKNIATRGR